ncbi:hypothetical protein AARAC_007606 [Aspergillus arachidicola]|uniref:Uncharacterized protein n=1 Tax=Aspergillus arachidicola TaxID=656916 RepID=A0A2G7FFH4_9EURO|nr:hypothetical protein AARAC_007606 [Aspergillus arachidicola]
MRNGEKKRKRTIHGSQRMRHNCHSDANERLIVYLNVLMTNGMCLLDG